MNIIEKIKNSFIYHSRQKRTYIKRNRYLKTEKHNYQRISRQHILMALRSRTTKSVKAHPIENYNKDKDNP